MDAGMGVGPNTPNMSPGISKSISPVKVFILVIIFSIVLIASYGLFINKHALLSVCLMIQFLLITLLTVRAILGIKDKAKENKNLSYSYLLVALFSLILGIISFLQIIKNW